MATGLAIAAIVISILSAVGAARVSYQVNGSGWRASESLLTDLATLLAALRSVSTKGAVVMGEQRETLISVDAELDTIRRFLVSTSGLALSLYAGEVGSTGASDDKQAGAWRVLPINFTNLAAMKITSGSDNQTAGRLAIDIERTLSTLNRKSIKRIRREIKDLPNVLSSLENSRQKDILLNALGNIRTDQQASADLEIERLRQLKSSGIDDPDIDLWLAVTAGDDDVAAVKDALDRGANPNIPLGEVLDRHKDVNLDGDDDDQ